MARAALAALLIAAALPAVAAADHPTAAPAPGEASAKPSWLEYSYLASADEQLNARNNTLFKWKTFDGSTPLCRVDGGALYSCVGWTGYNDGRELLQLGWGWHTFEILRSAEDTETYRHRFFLYGDPDTTPPQFLWFRPSVANGDTVWLRGEALSDRYPIQFNVDGTAAVECQWENGGWEPCAVEWRGGGNAFFQRYHDDFRLGAHVLRIRAIDDHGNVTPVELNWTVKMCDGTTCTLASEEGDSEATGARPLMQPRPIVPLRAGMILRFRQGAGALKARCASGGRGCRQTPYKLMVGVPRRGETAVRVVVPPLAAGQRAAAPIRLPPAARRALRRAGRRGLRGRVVTPAGKSYRVRVRGS